MMPSLMISEWCFALQYLMRAGKRQEYDLCCECRVYPGLNLMWIVVGSV
jgi:hypothetical protein